MEIEHPLLTDIIPYIALSHNNELSHSLPLSKTNTMLETSHDFCYHPESFKKLVEMDLPCNESLEEKLSWLRFQIIGNDAEFDSSFGRRKLVYADHTASGRSLHYSENFIINHLLPFYGMSLHSHHAFITLVN